MAALQVKKGVSSFKNVELSGPTGTYTVNVSTPSSAKYVLDVRVAVVPRAKGASKHVANEPRLDAASPPQRIAARLPATFVGHDFSTTAPVHVFVRGIDAGPATVTPDGKSATIVVPDVFPGSTVDVAVQNADGQTFTRAADAFVVPAPSTTDMRDASNVQAVRGDVAGGDALRVFGTGFDDHTRVLFGDVDAVISQVQNSGLLRIVTPAHVRGTVTVTVTDDFGRTATVPNPFQYVLPFWAEGDSGRLPAPTAVDDLSAARAAVGELGGGRAGDVVLATPLHTFEDHSASHGSRVAQTRVLREDSAGKFTDVTDAKLPAGQSLPFPYDLDDWNARAVAIGDLDGATGGEQVVAGFP
jgi:hypothetical protein